MIRDVAICVAAGLACGIALQTGAAHANGVSGSDYPSTAQATVLWIAVKSPYGYDNRYRIYPTPAACQEALQAERARAEPGATLWCARRSGQP